MSCPDVSFIIVSWNTKAYLARCLATVSRGAENLGIEVIVVDNGSSDGTQAMLAQEFPAVRIIQNAEHVGFGRGNNIGAQASRGRALLLLNSDCDLSPGALEVYAEALHRS